MLEFELELELELIQTHMAQKPMLRVEVGVLGAHQVKNMRGGLGRRKCARRLCGWVWVFWPRLGLSLTGITKAPTAQNAGHMALELHPRR